MRYIKLIDSEIIELENAYRNGSKSHFRDRCKSILMSNDGYKVSEIASFFKVRTRTIYSWFNNWENAGLSGLVIQSGRGPKSVLNSEDDELFTVVKQLLNDNPQNLTSVCDSLSIFLGTKVSKKMLVPYLKKRIIHGSD